MPYKHYIYRDPNTGYFYIHNEDPNFFLYTEFVDDNVTDVPLVISGFSYSVGPELPGDAADCFELSHDANFTWNSPDPSESGRYPSFYILHRIDPPIWVGVNESIRWPADYNGPWAMDHDPVSSGVKYAANVAPLIISSTSGTGETFSAQFTFASGTPINSDDKYSLKIAAIEFSDSYTPKITFRNSTVKNAFYQKLLDTTPSKQYWAICSSYAGSSTKNFLYDGGFYDVVGGNKHYSFDESDIASSGEDWIAFASVPNNAPDTKRDNLLSELESLGVGQPGLYIVFFEMNNYFNFDCGNNESIGNPVLINAQSLNPTSQTYPDWDCYEYSFQIMGINASGQGPRYDPELYTKAHLSTSGIGYTWSRGSELGWMSNDSSINYPPTCQTTTPYLDEMGNTWTLLSATGYFYSVGGSLLATTTTSAGPGKIIGSPPTDTWVYLDAIEIWRVSGPSGDSFCTVEPGDCGHNYIFPTTIY